MSETQTQAILQSVASGAISPSEAAVLLDALPDGLRDGGDDTPDDEVTTVVEPTGRAEATEPTTMIAGGTQQEDSPAMRIPAEVNLWGGPIDVVCEPSTAVPYADGPARVTVDGDRESGFRLNGAVGDDSVIALPSDVDLTIAANGSEFALTGIDGTVQAELNVGNVTIDGRFADGQSRLEVNAGDVELRLQPGSDVQVISTAPAEIHATGLEHTGRGRWSLGSGTATIEISGNLGSITITAL